MSSTRKCHK